MSSPRYDWWPNAVRMVRNYPARKAGHDAMLEQSIAADISGMPKGGGGISRTVENIATRQLAPAIQQEYDAVTRAVEITRLMPCGDKRMELIEMIYWRGKKLNIRDAIDSIGVAEATGKRWHGEFIRLVGNCFGYLV